MFEVFTRWRAARIMSQPGPAQASGLAASRASEAGPTAQALDLGWLPALSLAAASGLLLIAWADVISRSRMGQADPLFWAGLLTLLIPFAIRLISPQASRNERLGLGVGLGLALYLVKVMHSPFAFTFSDELIHLYNTNQILGTGFLFSDNSILAATPQYPGLEIATAALASLSGLTNFAAGLIIIGTARLVLVLALFLFIERVSHSARLAGLAVLLYTTNSNFLFWSVEFSYESLALPLAILAIFLTVRREEETDRIARLGFTLTALLIILTIVVTHHLTSYALAGFLLAVALVVTWSHKPTRVRLTGPWDLGLLVLILALGWQFFVATGTVNYLTPVFSHALESFANIIGGSEAPRQLFTSNTGYVAPWWERLTGLGAVILSFIGLPVGLLQIWRHYRQNAFLLVLAGAAVAYFGALGLRFIPSAWEIGNRASTFLVTGLGVVLAAGGIYLWTAFGKNWLARLSLIAIVAVLFAGGIIAGWPPLLRLSQPYEVQVNNQIVESQGLAVAHWTYEYMGPGNRVAAQASNAVLLMGYGDQHALTGRAYAIGELLSSPVLDGWRADIIRNGQLQYIVVDRRLISTDSMTGLYLDRTVNGMLPLEALGDAEAYSKFDKLVWASRILDSGNIALYDVREISGVR